jgi:hypothetical protein
MMKIDITNYEEWIIDWLDGNLNDIQVGEVLQFLEEHPELKEELGEIELFRLKPTEDRFTGKTGLQKSGDDLTESQFEYLCAACIENDLSDDQLNELAQITENNDERKKTLVLMGKTKLKPADVVYPDKKALYRRPVLQNALRLSLIGLSAAAVITIAFILYFTKTHELPVKFEATSRLIEKDSIQGKYQVQKIPENISASPVPIKKQSKNKLAQTQQVSAQSIAQLSDIKTLQDDSLSTRPEILISKVRIEPGFSFKTDVQESLISLNYLQLQHYAQLQVAEADDDGRSKIGMFITKTIREKFLREKSVDRPLKGYELAKAGVEGLNKLMGWEMALDERKDLEGNLKSVYFSSKLLKFNAPVKKSESLR